MLCLTRGPYFLLLFMVLSFLQAQNNSGDLTVHPGFSWEMVFESPANDPLALKSPGAIDLDPKTGELYVDNTRESTTIGEIIRINLANKSVSSFFKVSSGFGLKFSPEGTLYFSVGNFLLAKWDRTLTADGRPRATKFAIIPGVRGIHVRSDGSLLVGEGTYGPTGLYPETVLRVDPLDGYFEPLTSVETASEITGNSYNSMASVGEDGQGNLYFTFKQGQMIVKTPQGHYYEQNNRFAFIGGLNEIPLYSHDGMVYQYDLSDGSLFLIKDGKTHLIAYGPAIRNTRNSIAGVCSDGTNIYLTGDYNRIIRITAPTGKTVKQALETQVGVGQLKGVLTDQATQTPIAGALMDLGNQIQTTTDDLGNFDFGQIPAQLYEYHITKQGYLPAYGKAQLLTGQVIHVEAKSSTGLPLHLAPGLVAEVWAGPDQGVIGSVGCQMDREGNIYSMNIGAANISKHFRDPQTGMHVRSYRIAEGAGLSGAWSIALDDELNIYCSNGNDGVFKIPQLVNEGTHRFTAAPGDPTVVHNQFGNNMVFNLVRDVDGVAVTSDRQLLIASGNGGDPNPCHPEGTKQLVLTQPIDQPTACSQLFSRGEPCEGGPPLLNNPDISFIDNQGRLMLSNRNGTVCRIAASGCVDFYLTGDGGGNPAHAVGPYSTLNSDALGNLFLRGAREEPADYTIRLVTEDHKFYTVIGGMNTDYGGFTFLDPEGKSLMYADGDVLILIRTESGESIADVVKRNVTSE